MNIKKILMMGAICSVFAACDEPAPSVPPVQTNPQEPIINVNGISGTAAGPFAAGDPVALQSYADAGEVEMFTYTAPDSLPESATLNFAAEVSASEDFSGRYTVDVNCVDGIAYADVTSLDNAVVALYGMQQQSDEIYYRVIPYATVGNTNYRLGTEYLTSGKVSVICLNKWATYQASSYYFLGNATTWSLDEAADYPMTKQDDGLFVYNFEVKDGDAVYWKIAPDFALTYNSWTTVLGFSTDGDTSTKAIMTYGGNGAGLANQEGTYKVAFNPATREMTMTVLRVSGIFFRGSMNDWGTNKNWEFICTEDENVFTLDNVTIGDDQEFKIADADWSSINYGGTDPIVPGEEYTLEYNGGNLKVATSFTGSATLTRTPAADGSYTYKLLLKEK